MAKNNREEIINEYIELCKKLGKLATKREVTRFMGWSFETVLGSLNDLKEAALEKCPSLEELAMPVRMNPPDIEQYRLGLEKSRNKKFNQSEIKTVSSLDYLSQFSNQVFQGKVKPYNINKRKVKKIDRSLVLTLSDLHFGADIQSSETGRSNYGRIEESRRLARIIRETIEYKSQYRDTTDLHVNLLGDIIQNKLHDPQDAAPVAEQVCRAIHLLTQGFAQLGENFSHVYVHTSTGNHDRRTSRHPDRATSGRWDSYSTIIYYALKSSLMKYKNITFDIPKTPFVTYKVQGHNAFAVHGDNVLKIGNPGKTISVGSVEDQINRINASMSDTEEVKLVFVGHTHRNSISLLGSGANLITNGCLCPIDQFAVSIGILEGSSSQTLIEVTSEYALGDIRFLKVDERDDSNVELDKIIIPWSGL